MRAQGKGKDYCNSCSCVDDLAFVEAVLDALQAEFCTDKARVYATGMSHGGMMTYQVPSSSSSRGGHSVWSIRARVLAVGSPVS